MTENVARFVHRDPLERVPADIRERAKGVVPLFARVLLWRRKAEKIGSLYIPDEAAKRHASLKCMVLAVGPTADASIKVGDEVLCGRYAGDWLNLNGDPITKNEEAELFVTADEDLLVRYENA